MHYSFLADRAKQIKTKAMVNEDPTEKLIRDLKEENERLLQMLKSAQSGDVVTMKADEDEDDNDEDKDSKRMFEEGKSGVNTGIRITNLLRRTVHYKTESKVAFSYGDYLPAKTNISIDLLIWQDIKYLSLIAVIHLSLIFHLNAKMYCCVTNSSKSDQPGTIARDC